jgi:hypothetical protein
MKQAYNENYNMMGKVIMEMGDDMN